MFYFTPCTSFGAERCVAIMPAISDSGDAAAIKPDRVLRHQLIDRLLHWVIAACMFALLATGLLPVFGIKFNWVEPHWIVGLVLIAAVLVHVIRACTVLPLRNMWIGVDEIITSAAGEFSTISGKYAAPAKIGKYSVAQKAFHLGMSCVVLLAIGTGIIMMIGVDTPFWERDPYFVSEGTRGLIFVVHGFATLVSITMIILHVYFAIRPEKLYFMRSMIRGWISRAEYEENHDPDLWNTDDS